MPYWNSLQSKKRWPHGLLLQAVLIGLLTVGSVAHPEERPLGTNWTEAQSQEALQERAKTDRQLRAVRSLSRLDLVRDGRILFVSPGNFGIPSEETGSQSSFVDLRQFHWLQIQGVYMDLRAARYVPAATRLVDSRHQIRRKEEAHYLIPLHFSIRYELSGASGALVDGTLNILSRFTLGEKTDDGRMMEFETLEISNSRIFESVGRWWDGGDQINEGLIRSVGYQTLHFVLRSAEASAELEEIANQLDQQRLLRESQEYIQRANQILKNPRPLLIH